MIYVGIDWSDEHHDVCITDDSAQMRASFQVTHDSNGFATLHAKIKEQEQSPNAVLIAIETNRGLLVHDLLRSGYLVYAINPKSVDRFKDRYNVAKSKSDPIDAHALAHLLRTDKQRFKPLKPFPDNYRLLDRLCSDLQKLIDDKTRILNQITSILKEFYPVPLHLFSVDSRIAAEFLKEFPDPIVLQQCDKKRFFSFFKKHHYSRPNSVDAFWQTAQSPTPQPDLVVATAGKMRVLTLVDQLTSLKTHIAHYEQEIQNILDNLPETTPISTLPGVGKRLYPELVAALGPHDKNDPAQFHFDQDLARLSGCVPVTRQSGKWRIVVIRRACDKSLRRTLRQSGPSHASGAARQRGEVLLLWRYRPLFARPKILPRLRRQFPL